MSRAKKLTSCNNSTAMHLASTHKLQDVRVDSISSIFDAKQGISGKFSHTASQRHFQWVCKVSQWHSMAEKQLTVLTTSGFHRRRGRSASSQS